MAIVCSINDKTLLSTPQGTERRAGAERLHHGCLTRQPAAHPRRVEDRLHLFLGYDLPRRERQPVRRVPVLERRQVELELQLARQ